MATLVLAVPVMTHEDVSLTLARDDYLADKLSLEEFEAKAARILQGELYWNL